MNKAKFNRYVRTANALCSPDYYNAYHYGLNKFFDEQLIISVRGKREKIEDDTIKGFLDQGGEIAQGVIAGLAGLPPAGLKINEIKTGRKRIFSETMVPHSTRFPPSWLKLMPDPPDDYIRDSVKMRLIKDKLLKE